MEDLSQRIKERYVLFNFRIPRKWMKELERFPNRSQWLRDILNEKLNEMNESNGPNRRINND